MRIPQYVYHHNDRCLKAITHIKGKHFSYTTTPENSITHIHETSNIPNANVRDWLYQYDDNDRMNNTSVTAGDNPNATITIPLIISKTVCPMNYRVPRTFG